MQPQMPPGASVLRPLNPTTRHLPSLGAGSLSVSTLRRSSGSRGNNPSPIMLCVLPPPMACDCRKTENPAALPER